jgi:hypothetical protein
MPGLAICRTTAALFAALFLLSAGASAQQRVALVIGNGGYWSVPSLANPVNDAGDVAVALGRLGFAVAKLENAGFDAMRRAVLDLDRRACGAEMAVVFFAGHGSEVGGENWLIPVDADLRADIDTANEAIRLKNVILAVSGATKLGLVILDACRNDPFVARMQRTAGTRSVDRGLARVEPNRGLVRVEPTGNVLVAYAARDGTAAADGHDRNSPFTAALLRHIETPGLEVNFLFRRVHDDVLSKTSRTQQPYTYGALSGEPIYLAAAIAPVPADLPPSPSLVSPPQPAPPKQRERPFDGHWRLTRVGNSSCRVGPIVTLNILVANGRARDGFITDSGVLKLRRTSSTNGRPVHFQGTVRGNSGSGTFFVDGGSCRGTFKIVRA